MLYLFIYFFFACYNVFFFFFSLFSFLGASLFLYYGIKYKIICSNYCILVSRTFCHKRIKYKQKTKRKKQQICFFLFVCVCMYEWDSAVCVFWGEGHKKK